ncbi:MAG: rhomboid family intramembrane serine protease [Thermoguttaceae bacterium]|nr:rhomboid family intramembrane serine protease [Thermoguttaceae bacterium]
MGIYDRDYYRDDERPRRKSGDLIPAGWSVSAILIAANVLCYFANAASGGALFAKMALFGPYVEYPLQWYRCLTYGFAHDPSGLTHLLFNMLALFFFGPPIERRLGRGEFALFYLAAVLVGGVVWSVGNVGANASCLGASGAISAVVLLFAFYYPRAQVLIFGIIPTPAWLAGALFVVYDALGARSGLGNIAHDVHLAGAAFALVYYLAGVNFSELAVGKGRNRKSLKRWLEKRERASKDDASGPSTVPFKSSETAKKAAEEIAFEKLEAEVDRLLLKISESGEESLTEVERETLRRASREYQKRQK